MTPSTAEAIRLLRLARRDLQTYRILAAHPDASHTTSFHTQRGVERAREAALSVRGASFPRTHNLEELGLLVAEIGFGLPVPARALRRLTPFVVDLPYGEESIALTTREAAGVLAKPVFQWAKALIEAPGQ